jgi:hypothetical protein
MAYGFRLSAAYESGYVLTEDDNDHSPYDPGRNVFHAIINGRPSDAGHGQLVRWSLTAADGRTWSVEFTPLMWKLNARPVWAMQMERQLNIDGSPAGPSHVVGVLFGYQYTTADGRNVQEVKEIAP